MASSSSREWTIAPTVWPLTGGLSLLLSQHLAGTAGFSALPHLLAPLLMLAAPLYDFTSVILIRLRRGRPPWVGDHNHISHRLVRLGLSRRGAVLAIYALGLTGAAPVLLAGGRLLPPLYPLAGYAAFLLLVAGADFALRRRSLSA